MKRRSFLLGTMASLGLLGMGRAADPLKPNSNKAKAKAAAPLPFVPGSWTIVILPDTQNYATHFPGLLRLQTQWIADHKDERRIAYVLQNGDLTNGGRTWEWDRVDRAFRVLDGLVPYAIVPGNHDYCSFGAHEGREIRINEYFPPSRFEKWPSFGGTMEPGHIENNYHRFEAGGAKWLVIGLEWGPRDEALAWAGRILKKHSDHRALVFTHAYLYEDSTRYDWAAKGDSQRNNPHRFGIAGGTNDGEEMWNKLIKKHPNVFLVMNGHIPGDGLGFQISRADDGHPVAEMAVDYQRLELGGAGRLRLLEFLPDGKTVQVRSYSPLYDRYETDPQNQFRFRIDRFEKVEADKEAVEVPSEQPRELEPAGK
ncbi:MAG: metallophosphoesterase [Pirellulales bacterium]|nr:metallophosphoesterase [Pirellulales bacterium]